MIQAKGLTKRFGKFTALDGIDMNVKDGSIYGLVGTNGAGKTTILKLLAGVMKADSGSICVDDNPIYDNPPEKARISFIPDDLSFFARYNIDETEKFLSGFYPVWDKELYYRITGGFGLNRRARISGFSKGMQKQAAFAAALASNPDYLILDEPIDGLDPIVRRTIWKYIVDAAADRGMTTLVSSHNLREMEGFCDSIGIIDHGHMVLERDLDELKTDLHKLQISFGSIDKRPNGVYDDLRILHRQTTGSVDLLIVREDRSALDRFVSEKKPVLFDSIPLSLEEVFVYELGDRHGTYIYELSGSEER